MNSGKLRKKSAIITIGDGGGVKNTHLTSKNPESMFMVDPFNDESATSESKIQKMKKELNGILNYSLTDRQRQIFEMSYGEKLKMTDISRSLKITKQAVYYALIGISKKSKNTKCDSEYKNYVQDLHQGPASTTGKSSDKG